MRLCAVKMNADAIAERMKPSIRADVVQRLASGRLSSPAAKLTMTVRAFASPRGIMKMSEMKLKTIWFAERTFSPSGARMIAASE